MVLNDFIHDIFSIQSEEDFRRLALLAFQYQYQHNLIYKKYVDLIGCSPSKVNDIYQIPFLPISFFKNHRIISGNQSPELIFGSSGTTGTRSFHYVLSANIYKSSLLKSFELTFGPAFQYAYVCLLPSYAERNDSSLVYMANELIQKSNHPLSGFYLHADDKALTNVLMELEKSQQPTILLGVTFALLQLASVSPMPLKSVRIVETGGMKGRGKEMVRQEVHEILKSAFSVDVVYSEYGMTELLSQAYMQADGLFHSPPWMRIICRETEDPFAWVEAGRTGGINVIDLANIYSCCFIETQDLGKTHSEGLFEVIGRFDHSDIRGCNLMVI
ncbi:MAG: acyl transferase [Flavobacteriales bacterium]|nr:acyl transferase [Flavobacteriales bacterium]